MSEPAGPSNEDVGAAAARVVAADDPVIADLLQRQARGEKLSQSEYGKLGWWKSTRAKVASFLTGRSNSDGQPVQSRPGPGHAAAVASVASAQASGGGLAPVSPDDGLVKRTSSALLKQADQINRNWIAREARKFSADKAALDNLDRKAALPADFKDLMVEVSPDVLASMGVDPKNYPMTVFFGAVGMWITGTWLALDKFKADAAADRADRLQAEDKRRTEPTETT